MMALIPEEVEIVEIVWVHPGSQFHWRISVLIGF
jgi:hypothetical protein